MRILGTLLVALAVACGSPEPAPQRERITGLITAIDRGDDGIIESFSVHDGPDEYTIRIDGGRDYGFDLEHLEEHRASELPVRVTLERRRGYLYAVEILDA